MLATMRPAPIHSTEASTISSKQALSHQQSSKQQQQQQQQQQMNKPNSSTASRSKKGNSGGKQIAPGLLSLSKPIESDDAAEASKTTNATLSEKKARKSKKNTGNVTPIDATSSSTTPKNTGASIKSHKKKALAIDEIKADENQLSRSAPDSHASSDWDMPNAAREAASNTGSALTWQQELLNSQPASKSTISEKKKGGKKDKSSGSSMSKSKSASNHSADVSQNDSASSTLTWQQELFGSNSKARGTAFDVFADNKDAITFGGGSAIKETTGKGSKKKQRERADSLGEYRIPNGIPTGARGNKTKGGHHNAAQHIHLAAQNGSSSPSSGPPSTPNKLAYAGPNFHNSPSPASLPVPKFLQSKGNDATSNSSIFAREAQAQAQAQQHQPQPYPQQMYNQPQPGLPSYYAPPPPPPSQPGSMMYGGNYHHHYADPNISISSNSSNSSNSSEDDQDGSFAHLDGKVNPRNVRGVTAPPELPSTPFLNNGVGDESVNSINGGDRNITIENLLAKMMRPGSD